MSRQTQKIYEELVNISKRPHKSDNRYSLVMAAGDVTDVCGQMSVAHKDHENMSVVWLVTKGEVKESVVAVATATSKPPNTISTVKTMSEFVQSLGVCDKPIPIVT